MRNILFFPFISLFFISANAIAKPNEIGFENSANSACKNYDAHGFIDALARSPKLANQFVSPKIKIVKYEGKKQIVKTQTRKNYQFPIMIWDNFFILSNENKNDKPIN